MSESDPEYLRLAEQFMIHATHADEDVDEVRIEGSLCYINYSKPQTEMKYDLAVRAYASEFSEFKQSKLGVSDVTVYVTHGGSKKAEASARGGEVTEVTSY